MEATDTPVLTSDEFLGKVREKYPQYKDVPDEKLYGAMLTKYPQYKKTVAPLTVKQPAPVAPAQPSMLDRARQAVTGFVQRGGQLEMQRMQQQQQQAQAMHQSIAKVSEHLGRSVNPTLPDTQRQVEKRLAQIEQDKAKEALSSILPKVTPEQQMARGQSQASNLAIAGPNPTSPDPKAVQFAQQATRGLEDPVQAQAALVAARNVERQRERLPFLPHGQQAAEKERLRQMIQFRTKAAMIPENETTAAGVASQEALRGAGPLGAAMAAGTATGAALTKPGVHPAIPLIGGLATGAGAAILTSMAQDKLVGTLSPEVLAEINRQQAKGAAEHPVASRIGQSVPALVAFKADPKIMGEAVAAVKALKAGVKLTDVQASALMNTAFGSGTVAVQEGINQVKAGDFRPLQLAGAIVEGALLNSPRFGGGMKPQGEPNAQQALQTQASVATPERVPAKQPVTLKSFADLPQVQTEPAIATAEPVVAKTAPEPALPESLVEGVPSVEVPVSLLSLSADVPQFKAKANEKGVVEPLAGSYDRRGVAPIQVWRRLSGQLEVVSGRHRLDLAQRTGEKTIPAQVYDEASGFDAAAAARLDAELNIRDGQGGVTDYANYFKHSGVTDAEAKSAGLLARAKGKAGFAIATKASDDTFALHQAERLTDAQAEAIANTAPADPSLQAVGIRAALDGRPADTVSDLMRLAKQRVAQRKAENQQGDLFGFDDAAIREMEAQAKLASDERRGLREQITAVKGASKKPEVAKKLGVDVRDPAGVQGKVQELEARLALLRDHPELAGKLAEEPKPMRLESLTEQQLVSEQAAKQRRDTIQKEQDSRLTARPIDTTGDLFDPAKADNTLFAAPTPRPILAEPAATTTPIANEQAGGVRQVLPSKPLERQRGIATTTGAVGAQQQFAPIKPGRVSSPEAQAAQQMFDKQRADLQAKHRGSLSKMRDWFGSRFVAADSPIRRRLLSDNGERAVMMRDASLGASAESLRQYGKVEKEIYKTVPAHLEDAFADYIQAVRTVEVSKLRQSQGGDIASPGGLGDVANQKWIDEFAANHPREFASVNTAADKYFATMRSQLDALKAEGLLTDEQYTSLVENHKNYSPRRFIQYLDPEVQRSAGGNKITVRDSGIKSLDAGSEQSLVNNPRYLMGQVIASAQTRIFKNRANRALFDYVANDPNNGIGFRVAKANETPRAGEGEISLFENGEQKRLIGPSELADSWIVRDPQINSDLAKWLRVVSGSSLVKSVATGYNPEFAIANLPRDAAHAWFATREYSSILPRAAVQQVVDYAATAKDAFTRKGRAEHYIKEGGGMDFLVHQGALVDRGPLSHGSAISESIKQVQNVIGYLGETSELWGRLAVRERAIKNGKTPQEATIIARNYVDFGQGGTWVKAMDNVVPYLNAGVQGTRGVFRAFKESPATATFKVAQIMATAAGLTYWNRQANKEAWESISDSEKATKWIVTLPTYITDKDGNKRWQYIAIPKDQGQQVFAAVAEQLMEKEVTGKANPEAVSMAVKNMLPADVQSFMPPAVEAVLTYTQNHDFWRNRDVWQGREVSPKEEYSSETSPAFVAAGKATGMSPDRLQAAVNVVVPPSNPLVFAANSIAREMLPMDDVKVNSSLAQKIAELPGSRRILRMTYPQRSLEPEEKKKAAMLKVNDANAPRQVRTDLRKAEISQNDSRQQNDRKLNTLMNELRYGNKTKREVREWMQSVAKNDPREAQRLLERAKSKYGDQLRAAKE